MASSITGNPKTGYNTQASLSQLIKTEATQKTQAALQDIKGQAVNAATQLAKSASEKMQQTLTSGAGGLLGGLNQGDGLLSKLTGGADSIINAKLADTLFAGTAKDDLLTVDAYGIKESNILNSIVGKLTGFNTKLLENFRMSPGMVGDLSTMIKSAASGNFKIDTDVLKTRVLDSLSGSKGLLNGLSGTLQSTLTQGFGIPDTLYNKVEAVIGGAVRAFDSDNLTDARGIFNFINQITGDNELAKFFDVGAEANLLSGIFQESIRLGIPDAIDTMVEGAKSKTAADYALRANIVAAVTYSDVDTTALMIDKLGINRVTADLPDSAERLLANYRFPDGTTPDQYSALYTKLKDVLDKLQPGWGYYNRGGTPVSDLTLFARASDNAQTLLKMQPEFAVAAWIAPSYEKVALLTSIKNKYPLAVI